MIGRSALEHPILRLELRRVRRRRWWPGRRFFMVYPAALGAALGCGLAAATTRSLGTLVAALVTGVLAVYVLGALAWILGLALPWIAPALTAPAIARERERGTFDLLRTTLLTERSIILGKLGGCLVQLWPGLLTLALLAPCYVFWTFWGGLFSLTAPGIVSPIDLGVFLLENSLDTGMLWMGLLLLVGGAGLLRPWSALAFHASVGLYVSMRSHSSGTAIAVSYGVILAWRVFLWLVSAVGTSLFIMLLGPEVSSLANVFRVPGLSSLAVAVVESAGAILLIWAAIWQLKRG